MALVYDVADQFEYFLSQLKKQSPREWTWLVSQFRQKLIPFLRKRMGHYPADALLNRNQFLEEVIEESLLKFYELFETGSFNSYSDLEATIITVAGFKIKEGFARQKRERRLYFMEAEALGQLREKQMAGVETMLVEEAHKVAVIKRSMQDMEVKDKSLLERFFNGEELQDIAEDLSISAAACRKRKQRLIDKLKTRVKAALSLILIFTNYFQ